jgi:glycerate 2-kinase
VAVVAELGVPTVVVASDAFKGSLTSVEVGDAVRLGLLDVAPAARVVVVAVADGGEGTVAAAVAAGWTGVPVEVHGPTGEPVTASLAVRLGGSVAVVVEMADACGLGRLPGGVPAPLTASSRGLGEAIAAALDLGAGEVVVGIGGSASTDGGAGMLAALGARVLDADGADLPDGGAALSRVARLDLSGLDRRLAGIRLVMAADVDSPLLGPDGAATVFAPQKGASLQEVRVLEAALTRWAEVVAEATSTQRSTVSQQAGAGAAGGVGFALLTVLGAERRSGVEVVLGLVGLDDVLAGADRGADADTPPPPPVLVVTGEGSLDAQTLSGKAVAGVAARARTHGIPAVAVCGRRTLDDDGLATLGLRAAYPLSDLEPDPQRSIADAANLLRHTGRRIAGDWLSRAPG